MCKAFVLFSVLSWFICTAVLHAASRFSDEPEYAHDGPLPFKPADSYEQALQSWRTPEDINGWIAANFSYDTARAVQLSETQRTKNGLLSIYPPSAFFEGKRGVCVDLARFGVDTLRKIAPHSDPKYLMIEFDPVQVQGNMIRLHWLASFKRDGKIYFFADSKRPGYIAGPYSETQAFIKEYEQYRGRRVVTFREPESYEKQRKTPAGKQQRQKSPSHGTEPTH